MRIDCHCDTIMLSRKEKLWENKERHCDFARLIETVDIQFMAVFPYLDQLLPDYKEEVPILTQEMIRRIWEGQQIYGEKIKIIQNQNDLYACQRGKKLSLYPTGIQFFVDLVK